VYDEGASNEGNVVSVVGNGRINGRDEERSGREYSAHGKF
jgi:hypothetical protein